MENNTQSPFAGLYTPLTAEQTDAYLTRLGCERKPEPTLAYLAELMKAQLLNVPFEDLEVFHGRTQPSLNTADMFDKIVTRRRGGYCFELNGLFQKLLESLGYRCRNVIGRIALGRGHLTPPAHRVMLVELDGSTFFCDVGFGGPVPLSPIRLTENETLTCAAGRRYRFERGERETAILLERDGAFFEEKQIRALSVGSIFSMPRLEAEGLYEILKTARRKGVLTFGDLSADKRGQGFEGVRRFLPELDYFLPSIYDAREMTGLLTPEAIAEFYLSEGAQTVVIKLGEKGAYYRTEKEEGLVPAGKVKPVDTTGAGDCMNALFISRILAGDDTCTALRRACAGASLSTAFAGAAGGRITEKELLNL